MSNNKAREVNNPIIKQLLDETTAEELAKIDTEMTNNKQQTAVKLYTKNDLIIAIGLTRHGNPNWSIDEIVNDITPIELPTDEEIKKIMELDGMEFDEFDPYDASYLGGATWMRNLIQGGNK
jgi:hypothetical protein